MPKEVMEIKAEEHVYLHKDFHGAMSAGIEYLHQQFGEEAVREYLRQFARTFYAPLTKELRERGLIALKEYFERIYEMEGGKIHITFSEDEMIVEVEACPAVEHMRKHGYPVARLFYETTKTVNETICEGTSYAAELLKYEDESGRSVQRFYRRPK